MWRRKTERKDKPTDKSTAQPADKPIFLAKRLGKTGVWADAASPAFFAVLVFFFVLWNQHNSRFTLTGSEMNFLFFAMFAVSLTRTVRANENKEKCIRLIGISVALMEVYFYNWTDSGVSVLEALIGFQNGFNSVWSKLLLLMLLYLLTVGIRVIRWSQEDWEKIQQLNRERRRQRKVEFWEERRECWQACSEKHRKRRDNKQEQAAFLTEERRKEQRAKAEMRECRRESRKQELEINLKWQKEQTESLLQEIQSDVEEPSEAEKRKRAEEKRKEREMLLREQKKKRAALIIITVILLLYIVLPILGSGEQNPAQQWQGSIRQFVRVMSGESGGQENEESFAVSFARYTIFFIAFAGMLYVGAVLLYRLAIQCIEGFTNKDNKNNLSDFFDEYSTPLSVLIVVVAMLSTFAGTGAWTFDKLPELFKNMASIILCILLVMITVDAVRLILQQCVKKGSLLRTSMHIIFALLVDCAMGIVVGVLAELNIRGLLSSLFTFFLQGNRAPVYDKAEDLLDEALDEEMSAIRCAGKMQQETNVPYQRKRRNRMQAGRRRQSAFQKFHHKTKGGRR